MCMCKDTDDIVRLIKKRDNLSLTEARIIVDECVNEVGKAAENGASLEELEDIVKDWLGLEPDYLEIILNDMY